MQLKRLRETGRDGMGADRWPKNSQNDYGRREWCWANTGIKLFNTWKLKTRR